MSNPSPRPDSAAQDSSTWGKKGLIISGCKNQWGLHSGINCQSLRRLCLKCPQGPRTYTNPPTWGFSTRAPVAPGKWGEVMENGREPSKWHCSLFDLSPTYTTTRQQRGWPHRGKYLRLCTLQHKKCTNTGSQSTFT